MSMGGILVRSKGALLTAISKWHQRSLARQTGCGCRRAAGELVPGVELERSGGARNTYLAIKALARPTHQRFESDDLARA